MVTIIREDVILATCPLFRELLQDCNKLLWQHLGLAKVNLPVELVVSSLGVDYDYAAFLGIGGDYAEAVFLVTDYILKYVLNLNASVVPAQPDA